MTTPNGVLATIETTSKETREVTDQVQQRLREADDLERLVKTLQERIADLEDACGNADRELLALRPFADRDAELTARAATLDEREAKLDLRQELNNLAVTHERQRVDDHVRMCELIFRNTRVRRSTLTPVAVDGGSTLQYDSQGNQVAVPNAGWVEDRTTTTEEENH